VLPLALQHHLVSRYTSLIAVDQTPVRPAGELSDKTVFAATPPAGSAWASTGFARTATPAAQWFVLGCAFILLGLWLHLPRLRCRA
jgi:Ca-activated chloride channel homolog